MKRFIRNGLLTATLACCLPLAHAETEPGKLYIGVSAGNSSFDYSASTCSNDFFGDPCLTKTSAAARKIYLGYNINKMAALEFGVYGLGTYTATIADPYLGYVTTKQYYTAINADLVGNLDIGEYITLSAKVGIFDASNTGSDNYPGDQDRTASNASIDFGVRATVAFNRHISARAEYEHFNGVGTRDTNTFLNYNQAPLLKANDNFISGGLVYTF